MAYLDKWLKRHSQSYGSVWNQFEKWLTNNDTNHEELLAKDPREIIKVVKDSKCRSKPRT